MRKGRIVHGASLTRFLILCKKLSSEPFPFGRLNPKATRSRVINQRARQRPPWADFVEKVACCADSLLIQFSRRIGGSRHDGRAAGNAGGDSLWKVNQQRVAGASEFFNTFGGKRPVEDRLGKVRCLRHSSRRLPGLRLLDMNPIVRKVLLLNIGLD